MHGTTVEINGSEGLYGLVHVHLLMAADLLEFISPGNMGLCRS